MKKKVKLDPCQAWLARDKTKQKVLPKHLQEAKARFDLNVNRIVSSRCSQHKHAHRDS